MITILARAILALTLVQYVGTPDPSYAWRTSSRSSLDGVKLYQLSLTSQTFQGQPWRHELTVARPGGLAATGHALLIIGNGNTGEPLPKADRARLVALARSSGLVVAELRQVPAQPLFGGKIEDEAIAYTLMQYFQTGDDRWPLLEPMVKSVVRAMDALQAFAKQEWHEDLAGFTVTGESKRGWTTWLTAAVDPRVEALEPAVFDILNMLPQLDHQLASWGRYSEQMGDYAEQGLPKMLATPAGDKLREIIDPYSFKDALKQPKVIVLGTNDRYWPLDSEQLYVKDLPGPTYVLHLPNHGHDFPNHQRVDEDNAALALAAAGRLRLPRVDAKVAATGGGGRVAFASDVKPTTARLWRATSETRDFREAQWTGGEREPRREIAETLPPVAAGFAAAFVEVGYRLAGHPFTVTSPVLIYGKEPK